MELKNILDMQQEIQDEYNKIDSKWLELHYNTTIAMFIITLFAECFMCWIISHSDQVSTTIPLFILKFLVIPCFLNLFCILIGYIVMNTDFITQRIKIYIISLLLVVICFIVFTVHIAFSSLYFIFIIPIILTTIYANYRLTIITSISCLASIVISQLFITWDIDKVSIYESSVQLSNFLISLFVLFAFSIVCMVIIRFEREKNAASIQKEIERYHLQKRLQIDELTGIYNRKALHNAIKEMEEDDTNSSYIFTMIDIDNFKLLNDTYGHVVGDHCLIEFGKILKNNCIDSIPFRYGGDEFCILFKNHSMKDVVSLCEQIQKDFQSVSLDNNTNIKLTVSIGITDYSNYKDPARLIINTDKALYKAKTIKNTIHIYHSESK